MSVVGNPLVFEPLALDSSFEVSAIVIGEAWAGRGARMSRETSQRMTQRAIGMMRAAGASADCILTPHRHVDSYTMSLRGVW